MQIAEKEQKLQELLASPTALPDLTGCRIVHKMFGAGTVLPGEGQFMVIDLTVHRRNSATQRRFPAAISPPRTTA